MACIENYKEADFALYRFEPSLGAAALFGILFAVATILHLTQMLKTRAWYLTAFVVGGICETVGYITRCISSQEDPGCWTLGPYITQNVLLLIAPAFMAASVYMILGRIILLTNGESKAIIKRSFLTKVFVSGDVLSLLLQSVGGSLMALSNPENNLLEVGENTIIIGLFVQLACFGTFIVVAALFHRRMASVLTDKARQREIRWRRYLLTLYVTSALISIRSVFRVVEYLVGNDGYLMRHEVFLYVFDSVPMFTVMVWMNWFHPSEIGLLLRGEKPISNGLELFRIGKSSKNGELHRTTSLTLSREEILGN